MATEAEVAAVDRFLAMPKSLYGPPPEFGASSFVRAGQQEWQAVWPLADELGVVTSGQLRIVARPVLDKGTTITLVYNRQCVARLDLSPPDECERNPSWAWRFDLPAKVCGFHFHDWNTNRAHVLATGKWDLPCRSPLPAQIRRFEQAFPWFAAKNNIRLTAEQRQFEPPGRLV
jgi:hypothetical protein